MNWSLIVLMAMMVVVAADAQAVNMSLHDGPMAATAASRISSGFGSGNGDNGKDQGGMMKGEGIQGKDQGNSKSSTNTSDSSAGNNSIGSTDRPKGKSNGNTIMTSILGLVIASVVSGLF